MANKPIQEIDHLLTYVRDLGAAADVFRRMGFTLSPISRIEPMGISNHLVLMQPSTPGSGNYIELMSAHDRQRLPLPMQRVLSGDEGIKSIVLGAKDAAVAHQAMLKQGFDVAAPVHVKREWAIGPSQSVFPEFDVILPVEAPLTFNCCRYFNVELYLRPDWLKHANGAKRVQAVFAVAENPGPIAQKLGALFEAPVTELAGATRTTPGQVGLEVMTPAIAQRRFSLAVEAPSSKAAYLGYLIEVASLDGLRSCLAAGKVEHRDNGDTICVDPANGFGNLIVFREETEE